MKHRVATDDIRELAAAYSLGALEPEEARAFEAHLAQSCHVCRAEPEGFGATVSALGLSVVEQPPPIDARRKLLSRLNGDDKHDVASLATTLMPEFLSIRGGEGAWQELCDGVMFKRLYMDNASGLATSLVRMRAGTSLPRHRPAASSSSLSSKATAGFTAKSWARVITIEPRRAAFTRAPTQWKEPCSRS